MEELQKVSDVFERYRLVYPDLTEEELLEVQETLKEYIRIVARIVNPELFKDDFLPPED